MEGTSRHPGDELAAGARVDHFRVLRLLGRGGMGEVYLARDARLGRKVALKLVRREALGSSAGAVARFLFEARTTARFNHPHIVTVYAVGEYKESPYVALEYLEGQTLRERLDRGRPGVQEALRMALAIADALAEAHGHKVLHRDLKPQNVIIGRDGRLRVLDFGLAKIVEGPNGGAPAEREATEHEGSQRVEAGGEGEDLEATLPASADAPQAPTGMADTALAASGAFERRRRELLDKEESLWSGSEDGQGFASDGGIAGTPAYMAPEQWEGGAPGEGTDVWALGVLLFEMLAGRRPYEARSLPAQALAVCDEAPAPRLELYTEGVAADLSDLVADCLQKKAPERPPAEVVATRLRKMLARGEGATVRGEESPFRGLLPFGEEQAHLFFGREGEIAAAAERLRRQPVLPLIGPSGAGKSSFALAGLLPRLREQGPWVVLKLRPGRDPFVTLATRLSVAERLAKGQSSTTGALEALESQSVTGASVVEGGAPPGSVAARAQRLREAPGALALALARLAERQRCGVLLFVDQLEELATLVSDADERRAFVEAICSAADDVQGAVRVVMTLREEFLTRLAMGPVAAQVLTNVQVLTSPGPEALREILERPVEAVGYRFEDPSMVEAMLREVGGEVTALPLLQFAGAKLWERRDRAARQLTASAHAELGGVGGALAQHADAFLAALTGQERRLARRLLLRLVTPERTRRILTRGELCEGLPGEARGILERLSAARLVVSRQTTGDGEGEGESAKRGDDEVTVELVHESLIATWARLRRWLEEGREELRFLAEAGQAAKLWEDRGARPEEAWGGEALAEAERHLRGVAGEDVPPRVERFLAAGRARQAELDARRRRRRRWGLGLAVGIPLAIAVAASTVALLIAEEQRATERQRLRAEAQRAAVQRESARAALGRGDVLEARARLRASLTTRDSTLGRALWQRLHHEPLLWRRRFGARLYAAARSPDGRRLALAAGDGSIYLVDSRTSAVKRVLRGHADQVFSVAFSPDGRRLASGAWDGELRLWQLHSGVSRTLARFGGAVATLAFSPKGRLLAAGSWDHSVRLFSLASGRLSARLDGHGGRVGAVAFGPRGRVLASGGHGGLLRLQTLDGAGRPTGEARVLRGHRGPVYAARFSHDGGRLYSAGADGTVRLWSVAEGKVRRLLLGHRGIVWSLALSPDGKVLASGGWDRSVRLWSLPGGRLVDVLRGHGEVVGGLCFSPDGRRLYSASRDRSARAWRISSATAGRQRADEGHAGGVSKVAFAPDGRTIASGGQDGAIRLWSRRSGRELAVLRGHEGAVHALLFLGTERLASGGHDGKLRIWSVPQRRVLQVLHGHDGAIWAAARVPASTKIITASGDRTLRLWDGKAGRLLRVFHAHRGEVMAVAVAPRGGLVASGGADRVVRLWSLDGKERGALRGHRDVITGLGFAGMGGAAGGSRAGALISTALDGRVLRWPLSTAASRPAEGDGPAATVSAKPGGELLLGLGRGRAYSLAVSPDGRQVALPSSDGLLRVIALASRRRRLLRGHGAEVNTVAFSPDGKLLVSGSDDRSLRLWDVSRGRPGWRSAALLRCARGSCNDKGGKLLTHRGWRWLRDGEPAPPPRPAAWRRALEGGRLVRVAPRGEHLCQLTFGGRLKAWQRQPGAGAKQAAQLRFDWPSPEAVELVALPDGCALRSHGGRVERFTLDGQREVLLPRGATALTWQGGRQPSARSGGAAGAALWAALAGRVVAFGAGARPSPQALVSLRGGVAGDGGAASSASSAAGPTALARVGSSVAVGYRDGTVELYPLGQPGGHGRFAAEGAPSSPVRQILAGPRRTLVVGFGDGFVGVWDRQGGEKLFGRRIHGAIQALVVDGAGLHAISELGRRATLSLRALHRPYCGLLRELFEEIPVVWHRGAAITAAPPRGHRCVP